MSSPSNSDNFVEVVQSLQGTPAAIENVIAGLSESELRFKTADEFSILETICHLKDLEAEGYGDRIERLRRDVDPEFEDFDGARVAVERDYNNQEFSAAFRAFESSRIANVQKLAEATRDELEREGSLVGVGKINLKKLAQMMLEHDQGHLNDLRILRQHIDRDRVSY
jgi:hypothetical protein